MNFTCSLRSSVVGDIVLYYHAKTAIQWIRKLETATKTLNPQKHDKKLLVEWLQRARALYSLFGGKMILLEVKLNISLENDLISQLNQYICAEYICLSNDQNNNIIDFEKKFMFVIDVYAVYRYDVKNKKLVKLFDLDKIKNKEDIIVNMCNAII